MKVSELMNGPPGCGTRRPACGDPADGRMRRRSVLLLEDGTLRGIVTDRDLTVRRMGCATDLEARADALMSPGVVQVEATDALGHGLSLVPRHLCPPACGSRPGPGGGVLTIDNLFLDVLRRFADLLGPVACSILQEPPSPPSNTGAPHEP